MIPENFQTLSQESESFFKNLAQDFLDLPESELTLKSIENFAKQSFAFSNSIEGLNGDCFTNEVSFTCIEFLHNVTKISENKIETIWFNVYQNY